jgi:AraC family transcriptional regulator
MSFDEVQMPVVDKAVWIIERNSGGALTLGGIAEACGVSRSHLANAFGTATGLSVMHYVRARRLTEAARALAAGAPDILTVALNAGYGSHEAFTRAFRDQFNQTPDQVRSRGSLDGLTLVDSLKLSATPHNDVDPPRIVLERALRVVGLAEHCSFNSTTRIPAQWQRFMSDYYDAVPAKIEKMPVGVSQPAEDDGEFQYVCGAEVSRLDGSPRELVRLEIPARRYAVFDHRGHVSTLYDTYVAIWNQALPAAGLTVADAPAIERHNPTFDPGTGTGGLTVWIPLSE